MTVDEKAFEEWWNEHSGGILATHDRVKDLAAIAFEAGIEQGIGRTDLERKHNK